MISNELLMRFKNSLGFAGSVRHEWDDRFGQPGNKIGDTFKLRVPVQYSVGNGASITPQDTEERSVSLTIDKQKHVAFQFTSKDMTLSIDRFADRYLQSAAQALANQFDVDGLTTAYQATFNYVGVPGTTPTSLKTYQQAAAWLDKEACPIGGNDRFAVYTPDMQVEVINDLRGLIESGPRIRWQYEEGRMKRAIGLNWLIDQNVRTHTTGPFGGTPAVVLATTTGTTLSTSGWTAAAASRLTAGDIVQLASVYAVNPITKDTLANLKNWTVAEAFSSAADGTGLVTLTESIAATGAYQNCSALPADGALISIYGKAAADQSAIASKSSPQGLVYHRNAFVCGMVPLDLPGGVDTAARSIDKETGMSIRIVSQYNVSTDMFITRADIVYGWAAAIPEWACRVVA